MTLFARRLAFGLGAVIVLTALAVPAFAQGFQGSVRGTVTDAQGGLLPGATVKLRSVNTGATQTQVSTASGTAFFTNLLVGTYSLEVELPGFKKYERQNVIVQANTTVDVFARLDIGQVSEVITVTAGADLVKTTTSQLEGATFNAKQLIDIPLQDSSLTGDVNNFAVLAPGVGTQPGGVVGQGGTIGGNRPRNNNFVIDGLDNNSADVTGAVAAVIQDAVEEFTLLTNQFNAEFGHSTAGQFITTTKSGSNEFHGGVWEYNINRKTLSLDNLNAATAATDPSFEKPRFDRNRFGGQLGGPIIKNKLFFYGAYEYQNLTLAGSSSAQILVPTGAGLSALEGLAANPASGISPIAVGILRDHVPTANSPTGDFANVINSATGQVVPIELGAFSANTPNFLRTHLAQFNLDAQPTANHRVSVRLQYGKPNSIAAGPLPTPEFNATVTSPKTKRGTLSHVWNVSSNVINEFRAAYTQLDQIFDVALPAPPGSGDIFGNYIINDIGLEIGPTGEYPQAGGGKSYQFSNNTTWIAGAHTFKVGGVFGRIGSTSAFLPRSRGEYAFVDLDQFVHDQIPTGGNGALRGVGSPDFIGDRNAWHGFVQDSWKVKPNLTLDLGVRYEYTGIPKDSDKQELNAIASITDIRNDVVDGVNVFNTLSQAHQQLLLNEFPDGSLVWRKPKADKNNISPRFGFAWDINGDGKSSLRGGFAIAHDVLFGNLALLQLPPQAQIEINDALACVLSPAPAWCSHPDNVNTIAGGFLAGGSLLNVVPNPEADRTGARAATTAYVYDDKVPETITWSLSYQREMFRDYLLELRYIGTKGRYLPLQRRFNAGVPNPVALPIFRSEADALSRNYAGAPTLADFQANQLGALEPYGFFGTVTAFSPIGTSLYNGGSIQISRRLTNGFGFITNYTLSRTEDEGENELFTSLLNPRRLDDSWDFKSNRGRSGLDKTHKAVVAFQWELPKPSGGGLAEALLGGWSLNGSFLFETGQGLTILSGRDVNGNFDAAGDRAFENPSGAANTGTDTNFVCFNGSASYIGATGCGADSVVGYVAANPDAQFVRGRTGAAEGVGLEKTKRGRFHGPGNIRTVNMSLYKTTNIGGKAKLRFGAYVLNLTNTPSYALGGGSGIALTNAATSTNAFVVPGTPQFLQPDSFSGSLGQFPYQRIVQFEARISF